MTKSPYRVKRWDAMVFAVLMWALATGLAVEKLSADGVQSWTLFAAMPILLAAICVLIHEATERIQWNMTSIVVASVMIVSAIAGLAVTLPNSIGASVAAQENAAAEAAKNNRPLELAKQEVNLVLRQIAGAESNKARECAGAPSPLPDQGWPKCKAFSSQVEAFELRLDRLKSELQSAPAEKPERPGEAQIAWVLHLAGVQLGQTEIAMLLGMLPPIVFELLSAVFFWLAVEGRRHSGPAVPMVSDAVPEPNRSEVVIDWVREFEKANGRKPMIKEVQMAFPGPKTSTWRLIKAA